MKKSFTSVSNGNSRLLVSRIILPPAFVVASIFCIADFWFCMCSMTSIAITTSNVLSVRGGFCISPTMTFSLVNAILTNLASRSSP